ncbi:MAG: hypothetical protein U5Q44_09815 [Dehalococcoidia bacterium]|nr:hypothetical protein [Dehalococcoidia bacterium]
MLTVAGLGPGSADLVTRGTERLLREAPRVILRTRHHPAVGELAGSDGWEDCDDLYCLGELLRRCVRRHRAAG